MSVFWVKREISALKLDMSDFNSDTAPATVNETIILINELKLN